MTVTEYNKCVDIFSDNAYRFILKNIKDSDAAKDIIQDSFEKLWINAKNIDYQKAKSYLFTTAYHTMIDYIRKNKKNVDIDITRSIEFSDEKQYSDLQELLHEAVNKLPEIQKSVVMLRDYEGYSYQEIAEITNLSEAQVKVYIYRARLFLKKYIGSLETVI